MFNLLVRLPVYEDVKYSGQTDGLLISYKGCASGKETMHYLYTVHHVHHVHHVHPVDLIDLQ